MLSCLSLLLAVTTLAQDSVAPKSPARRPRRTPIVTVAPMTIEPMTTIVPMSTIVPMMLDAIPVIEGMPGLEAIPTIPPMTMVIPDLQAATAALTLAAPTIAMAAPTIEMALTAITPLALGADFSDDESWDEIDLQEPGDSLYRAGRTALNNNRYEEAA